MLLEDNVCPYPTVLAAALTNQPGGDFPCRNRGNKRVGREGFWPRLAKAVLRGKLKAALPPK